MECIAAASQVLSSTSSLQSTQYSLPSWQTCWRIFKLIFNLLNNIIKDIRDSTELFLNIEAFTFFNHPEMYINIMCIDQY